MLELFLSCVIMVISLGAFSAVAHEGVNVAIATLDTRIQKDPHNVALYIERAVLFRREGQFTRALADLALAQKLDPQRREIVLEKGLTLAAKGETKEAESLLGAFLSSGLPSAKALEARGKIREIEKRFVEARADYAAAVALVPGPDLFLARGRMDEALGHWDEAVRGYEEGLRALSGAVVLRLALVRVEHQRGHYDRAIALIDEILPHLSVKADFLLLRADQYAASGRAEKARQDREDALREADGRLAARPTHFVRVTRAKALLALGRKKEAIVELEMVVAHAPQLEEARKLLEEIRPSSPRK